jgi:hypothetical protein
LACRGQPPIHLALARIRSAELLERPREVPLGFDLTEFLRRGELDVPLSAAPIHLRFRIHRDAGGFLFDSRFADDRTPCTDPVLDGHRGVTQARVRGSSFSA